MHADTAASELELQEMKARAHNSPRTSESMKNSVQQVEEGATVFSRFDGENGNGVGNNARGSYNWFAYNFSMMSLGCFGMSLGDEDHGTEENIRSPLLIGSTKISTDIEESEKKCFLEWLNHHELDQSDEEWKLTLTRLKDGVIQLGIRLSHLLLRFLILESERGDNMKIFNAFRDTVGGKIDEDYKTLVVVERVLKLVEMAEKAVANLKNKVKKISIISMDPTKKRKDSIDIANNLCSQILALHMIVNEDLLTKYDLVKKMEESFGEVEEELTKIEQYICTPRVQLLSSVEEGVETVEVLESQLESKVREMWSRFGLDPRVEYDNRFYYVQTTLSF
ncbi:hypothetical protein TIFTF001_036008 [Ficus carica]|uniref:Uncharacterized protein n=1 Tax=Ficus carica TaxID=3494 RepID=A0AA88E3E2_FICCA|nr:hypothetical protein TIFTF001_035980 [Ficus carica]GMN66925.1 hypothetical protein TIFTF001_035987 [Ficus carica]GMN66938.1 hypothetical protein TIFTF001_036001 [Ficus carica]GMN66946.1 hypothetical protein TIFTF001_036008 [Ficus carica]